MTTIEILTMALHVASAAFVSGERPRLVIGRVYVARDPGDPGGPGVRIDITPDLDTGEIGRGTVAVSGSGADIDAAARDMLPGIYRAEEMIRQRVAKQTERDAEVVKALGAAT